MNRFKTILILLPAFLFFKSSAQVNCATLDINKVPGKWVWQSKVSFEDQILVSQWKFGEPIRKEMQRIMPVALDGLYATNSIAFPKGKAFWYSSSSPAAYENYLMLKKYECLKGYNELKPEGVTGCWVYFSINQIDGKKFPLPEQGAIKYHAYESNIRVTNIEIQTDAAGNKIIYAGYRPDEMKKHCYYFSARRDFPLRKITNRELFLSYKMHHEKKTDEQIAKFEKLVIDDEKKYNSLSAAEKQQQNYWPDIIRKNKDYLKNYTIEKEKITNWYNTSLKQSTINDTAYVTTVNQSLFYPEKLTAKPGEGYSAWVDNLDFFDKTKPKDEPQCIAFYVRREDDNLPKKNFMDLFHSQFNMDVPGKMVGETPKKSGGINSINASVTEIKTTTKAQQTNNAASLEINFDNTKTGTFPLGWEGMKNISVQPFENRNWLVLNKNGYWFPRQYNKEISNNFSLSFDVSWNKEIPYSSGLFTVSLSGIPYDNAIERYKMEDSLSKYWSFYDSYAGNFNRVVLWFDPYWNGGGTLEVYSYDQRENIIAKKRITLPDFYMAKNNHQINIRRKGNALVVFIDDKKEAELENIFLPAAKYNLYAFSRYKGSDDKMDVFYLNNIKANY